MADNDIKLDKISPKRQIKLKGFGLMDLNFYSWI